MLGNYICEQDNYGYKLISISHMPEHLHTLFYLTLTLLTIVKSHIDILLGIFMFKSI